MRPSPFFLLGWFIWALMVVSSSFPVSATSSSSYSSSLLSHTYWSPTPNDIEIPHSPFTVSQPVEWAGQFVFAHTSTGGPLFRAGPENDYQYQTRLILPHSEDGFLGCSSFNHSMNDEGDSFEGSILLLERGGCSFTQKLLNAVNITGSNGLTISGLIVYGCSYEDGCRDQLLLPAAFDFLPVPLLFITTTDGQSFKSYLLQRRQSYTNLTVNGTLIQPSICNTTINLISTESATLNGCVLPGVEGYAIGTGELVDPAEAFGLQALAHAWTFDETKYEDITWLRSWTHYLAHPEIDPCTSRITGLYCEKGRIVSLDVSALGVSGTIPEGGLKAFTELRYLLTTFNLLTGPIPIDLCYLTNLITVQFDSNSFTALPECVGGGWFNDTGPAFNTSTYYPGLQSLVVFAASYNQLTNLPPSFGQLGRTLKILAVFQNRISQLFPIEYFKLDQIQLFEFYGNANLTLDLDRLPPTANFHNFTSVTSILLRECNIYGQLPSDWFDGCINLVSVDLSSNSITGSLPNFTDCNNLQTISLLDNHFTGEVPVSWSKLNQVTAVNLQQNQLGPIMDGLSRMSQLKYVYLSYNNITGSVVDNVGESLFHLIGTNVIELFLDHNSLIGPWSNGGMWLPLNLRTINLAYNHITNLPDDLWQEHLEYIDLSFNDLRGPLPHFSPAISTNSFNSQPPVRTFFIEGNPGLVVDVLPTWLKFSNPPVMTLSTDGLYLCQQLVGVSELFTVDVDPTFTNYQGCQCARGLFGKPPLCSLLPQSAIVTPYLIPASGEIGNDFIELINSTDFTGANVNTSQLLENTTFTVPFMKLPTAFTDEWYGDNRFTPGMGTRWVIDLSSLLLPTTNLTNELSSQILVDDHSSDSDSTRPDTSSLSSPYQSIRVITVRIHLSRRDFSTKSTLSVYAGPNLTGERVDVISGYDSQRIANLPSSTPFTSTPDYQATYASDLSKLADPVVLEIPVLSSQATILFDSRSQGGCHFVATYSYSFKCPDGLELPDPTTTTGDIITSTSSSTSTPTCVAPQLGTKSSVLILLLGIGGGLIVCAFIWLMYERYQRQRAQQVLHSFPYSPSFGSKTNSTSSMISDHDLHANADHLSKELKTIAYKRLVRELVFEIGTAVWELSSTILNWVVVGQVLSGGTTNLSPLSVGYIIVVIVSTFAVGANTISRITNFQSMKHQVELEVIRSKREKMDQTASVKSDSVTTGDHSLPIDQLHVELQLHTKIKDIHHTIRRLRIHLLSIVLHALPFIILNVFTLYEGTTDLGSSKSITIQISLLLSFLLVGMKIQELKEYPNQQKLLLQAKYDLVQFKIGTLETKTPTTAAAGHSDGGDIGQRVYESPLAAATIDQADIHINGHQVNPLHQLRTHSSSSISPALASTGTDDDRVRVTPSFISPPRLPSGSVTELTPIHPSILDPTFE